MGIFFTGLRRGNLLGQVTRGLALALGLVATQPALAFDAAISSFNSGARSSWPVLAGFESMATQDPNGATLDYCRVRHENLRVGPTLGFNRAGNSIIDLRGFLGNSGFIRSIAPREIFDNVISNVPNTAPALTSASAADIAQACSITDFTIVTQTSPNGTNYANSSYHGIIFRGRQDGVLYQWEVAFSGQTNTQFINTRTAVVAAAPEIALSGDVGGAVTDGGTSAQGNRTAGTPVTVTYTVSNSGTGDLTLATATAASPSNVTVGAISAPAAGTVAAGSTTTFTVTYTPTAAGAFSFNLSFVNNDSDENPFNFTVSGTGVAPAPVISLAAMPSATQQTVGRDYTFTVTPSVTGSATTGTLTLTTTLPTNQSFSSGTGTGWSCNAAGQNVTCTSDTSIAAGSNGNPVTITVTPATAIVYSQAFSISGGGAAAAGNTIAAAVTVNGLPDTNVAVPNTTLTQDVLATPFTPVTATGGTRPFRWSVSPPLPNGLLLDAATGQITGTPRVSSPATNYVFSVMDARDAVTTSPAANRTASITVQAPAPAITTILPRVAPLAGGNEITISGTNLANATSVNFGVAAVVPASAFLSNTADTITLRSPAGAAGAVDVSVTTAGGTSANTVNDDFTYILPPTATVEFLHRSIPADGTTIARYRVTVTNPNAVALTGVSFSQRLPSGLTIGSRSSSCNGFTPTFDGGGIGYTFASGSLAANASCFVMVGLISTTPGSYNITLSSLTSDVAGDGTLPTTATALTVSPLAPSITGVLPAVGPLAGNIPVTINGTSLLNATQVDFGGTTIQSTSFTSNTDTAITVTAPSGAVGAVDIRVTTAGGTSANTVNDNFTYLLPPTATVEFLDTSIPADGSTTARYRVTVSNPNAVALGGITITQDIPSGLFLTLIRNTCGGSDFINARDVSFADVSLAANASCTVTLSMTSRNAGPYNMTLRTVSSGAGNATIPAATSLTVAPLTPSITGVSPAVGPLAGNIPVTISGTNLLNATQVVFGGTTIQSTSFTSNTDTAITLNAPSGAVGAVDISVTTPNGTDTEVAAFTYGAVPVLTAFTHADAIPYNAGGAAASTIDAAVASSPTGSPTSYAISAASANGAVVSVTNGGAVSYTPAAGFHGTDTFGLTASNAFGASAQVTVTVTVTNPSFIASGVGASATVGAPYLANVRLLGGTVPYSAFSATGLPDGLTISSGGTISGIPTTAGTFNALVVSATDSSIPPFSAAANNRLTITVAQGTQTITFNDPGAQDFGTSPTLTASATSGLGVTFSSLTSAVCTVTSGGALTFVAAGSCQIAADQAGNANYLAAPQVTRSFTVNTIDQVITFTNPGAQTMGTSPTVTASSTSGLTVAFSSLTPAVCTVTSGGALTLVAAGNCEIAANQAGNGGINAAAQVTQSFAVNAAAQTITFANPGAQTLGTSPSVSATATSGLTVTFSSLTPAICTVTLGGALTLNSAGNCQIAADQAGNATFAAAARVTQSFAVNTASQTITFANPGAQTMGTSPTITATATSGLDVTFTSLTTAVCTVTTDGALTFVTVGICEIAADQAGDATFAPAAQVTQSFAVGQQGQTIDLPTPEPFGGKDAFAPGDKVSLAARSSSGLPVVFTGLTPQICSISSDGLLTFLKPGTCSIAADQPGNAVVAAAARVVASIQVGGVDPEAEVDLVTNMQVARARSLLFNQPDLSPLLEPEANESTAINVSTRGADIDVVRMGGPTWMRMSGSMSRQEGGASTGYLQFSLGTHAKLGPNTILGLMGTVDTMRMDDPLGTSEGEGWLVGPYFVSKLGQSALVLEMRALTGRTHDSVAQTGQRASTVWGDRTLLMAKLSGSYQVNEKLALMPSINLAAVNSSSDPYTAAGGTQIAAVRTAYRQQSVDIDWRYEAENSAGKHVFFGGLGWFNSQEQQVRAGQGLKYSVGISQDFGTNSNIRFEVTGARDFDNNTNRLGASLLFSSQF